MAHAYCPRIHCLILHPYTALEAGQARIGPDSHASCRSRTSYRHSVRQRSLLQALVVGDGGLKKMAAEDVAELLDAGKLSASTG